MPAISANDDISEYNGVWPLLALLLSVNDNVATAANMANTSQNMDDEIARRPMSVFKILSSVSRQAITGEPIKV